jgi:CHRD domain/Secretion system C-terminal sorting domain
MKIFYTIIQLNICSMKSLAVCFRSCKPVFNLALAFIASSIILTNIAQSQVYTLTLNGATAAPPNGSLGVGSATVTITGLSMKVVCSFSGLTGTVLAAHIHGPTVMPGSGTAGVAVDFAEFPTGVTSGSYDVSTFVLTQTQKDFIAAGKAYINIHSSAFGGGEISGFFPTPPLAIDLGDITIKQTEEGNRLNWNTANETNNKGFQVERSKLTDDKWEVLGFVKAKGKAASYDFIDNAPFSMSYYRLRQIDFDGKESLSKVVSIASKGNKKLKIFPNPVSNVLTIETEENSVVHILNLLGQEVISSNNTQRLDVSFLPRGTYIIKAGEELSKFVKQ